MGESTLWGVALGKKMNYFFVTFCIILAIVFL